MNPSGSIRLFPLLFLLVGSWNLCWSQLPTENWTTMVEAFNRQYRALQIPPLRIEFADNLNSIQDSNSILQQAQLFDALKKGLSHFEVTELSAREKLELDLLHCFFALNEIRIGLETQWVQSGLQLAPSGGLLEVPNGKAWYRYFLRRWIDLSVEPDSLYAFGLAEIEKVKIQINSIQAASGFDQPAFQHHIESAIFYHTSQQEVQQAFEEYANQVANVLPTYFEGISSLPEVFIQPGTIPRLAKVPAYYSNNTFYYNFFDEPFNKRQVAWIYLHEAVPGHHYEYHFRQNLDLLPTQLLFNNPGFSEGWAAYIEEIGDEIGAYRDVYDALGKWEWDLIRSVRVSLDVGINYYGWTDEKAIAFWKEHIQDQDAIGYREIDRIKRWPCQVITYKYGAAQILSWKKQLEARPGFNLKSFHLDLLKQGPLPFSLLEKLIFK